MTIFLPSNWLSKPEASSPSRSSKLEVKAVKHLPYNPATLETENLEKHVWWKSRYSLHSVTSSGFNRRSLSHCLVCSETSHKSFPIFSCSRCNGTLSGFLSRALSSIASFFSAISLAVLRLLLLIILESLSSCDWLEPVKTSLSYSVESWNLTNSSHIWTSCGFSCKCLL